jgi:hypothetical protein
MNTIHGAHGIRVPDRCHDCGATDTDLHHATWWNPANHTGGQGFLCPCCAQHPDHPTCPRCPAG